MKLHSNGILLGIISLISTSCIQSMGIQRAIEDSDSTGTFVDWTVYTKQNDQVKIFLRQYSADDGATENFLGPVVDMKYRAKYSAGIMATQPEPTEEELKETILFMAKDYGTNPDSTHGPFKARKDKLSVNLFLTEVSPDNPLLEEQIKSITIAFSQDALKNAQMLERGIPTSSININQTMYKVSTLFWDALQSSPLLGGTAQPSPTRKPYSVTPQSSVGTSGTVYVGLIPYNDTSMLLRTKTENNNQVVYPFLDINFDINQGEDYRNTVERTEVSLENITHTSMYKTYLHEPYETYIASRVTYPAKTPDKTFVYFKYIADPAAYNYLKNLDNVVTASLDKIEIVAQQPDQDISQVKIGSNIYIMNNNYLNNITWPTKDKLLRKGKNEPDRFEGTIIPYTKNYIILGETASEKFISNSKLTTEILYFKKEVSEDLNNLIENLDVPFLKGPYSIEKSISYQYKLPSLSYKPSSLKLHTINTTAFFKELTNAQYNTLIKEWDIVPLPLSELGNVQEKSITDNEIQITLANGKEYEIEQWLWNLLKASGLFTTSITPPKPAPISTQTVGLSLQQLTGSLRNLANKINITIHGID